MSRALGYAVALCLTALPAPASEPRSVREIAASRVELVGVVGDVSITATSRRDVRIDVPEASLAKRSIEIKSASSGVTIRQTSLPAPERTMTITRGSGVSISTVIGGYASADLARISIEVPVGTPVAAHDLTGRYTIGDGVGTLTASVKEGTLRADKLTSPTLYVKGAGTIAVRWADGIARLTVEGAGSIMVADARLSLIEALVSGSGEIDVQGRATTAKLLVSGVGNITVKSATVIERTVSGVGTINVLETQ